MKYPTGIPFEVMEVANEYTLLQIGLTYNDVQTISSYKVDMLLTLHSEIKKKEEKELNKSKAKMR